MQLFQPHVPLFVYKSPYVSKKSDWNYCNYRKLSVEESTYSNHFKNLCQCTSLYLSQQLQLLQPDFGVLSPEAFKPVLAVPFFTPHRL